MTLRFLFSLAYFIFLPTVVFAETLQLVCVGRDGFTVHFTVDTTNNVVLNQGMQRARLVHIDKTSFSFVVDLPQGEYFHVISRSNGNMSIGDPNGTVITGFQCDKAKPKF